jgi:hypothetical protein
VSASAAAASLIPLELPAVMEKPSISGCSGFRCQLLLCRAAARMLVDAGCGQPAGLLRSLRHLGRFRGGPGKRLFAEDVLTGVECRGRPRDAPPPVWRSR